MSHKKDTPQIKVVFDTNLIRSSVATDLCNSPFIDFIKAELGRDDILISWYIPDVVLGERRYQMRQDAKKLLNSVKKLEKEFKYSLNVKLADLEKQIDECIKLQLDTHQMQTLSLDTSKVSWKDIIQNACNRNLPFSDGDSEKGFRDAMIAETFLQLVDTITESQPTCRIALVTGDAKLHDHAEGCTRHNKNVKILFSLDELQGLINTLTSEFSEEEIKEYQSLSSNYFFNPRNQNCLYYKNNLNDQLNTTYQKQLTECPPITGLTRKNIKYIICNPQFVKKAGKRVSWTTKIEVAFEILKNELNQYIPLFSMATNDFLTPPNQGQKIYTSPSASNLLGTSNTSSELSSLFDSSIAFPLSTQSSNFITSQPPNVIVTKGKTIFEIKWNVNIDKNNELTQPHIESINYIDTYWEAM